MTQFQAAEGGSAPLHAAAEQLFEILDGLPHFEPCRGPVECWPEEIRKHCLPVWDLWPRGWHETPPQKVKETWFLYGGGWLIWCEWPTLRTVQAPASGAGTPELQPAVERVRAASTPAESIPAGVRETLLRTWAGLAYGNAGQPLFIRNVWHERRELVKTLRPEIDALLPGVTRAITRAAGDVSVLKRLKVDDVLDIDTVDLVVAQLRRALPPAEVLQTSSPTEKGTPALLTGRQAAEIVGVSVGTLSRWRRNVPAWAMGSAGLFRHLVDLDHGGYTRHNIRKLAKWFEAAEKAGGQAPIECP